MSIGITDEEQKIIIDILDKYKEYLFYFYGSRVKGTYEKTSDLDILIKGKQEMSLNTLEAIKQAFDESKLPYIVNLSDYHSINENFYKKIEKDLFPYNWKECKLGDLCNKVTSGGTPKSTVSEYYEEGNIPWLNTKEVHFNRIYSTEKYITELGLINSSAKWINSNNVIIAMYGATAGNVAINKIPMTTNQACCNLEIDAKKADYNFIYYYLLDKYKVLSSMANGGAQQNLNSLQIKDFALMLPPLETQQKIAKVLGAIDDKIELNNSINKNLEQQAQHYFDEIVSKAAELSYIAIDDICDVKGGKRLPKGINLVTTPNSHPYIRVRDLNDICVAQLNSNYEYVDDETQKTISRYTVSSKDVIISIVGTIGLTAIVGKTLDNANLTENCVKLTNIKTVTSEYILLFLRSKEGQEAIKQNTVGAVQAKLPIKNIQSMKVPVINNDDDINKYLEAIFNTIAHNIIENSRLTQLRDTLLPKLMSGEIDVDKVDIS